LVVSVISVLGSAAFLVLGWFLRRLVGQIDVSIAELRTAQAALRDRLEILRQDVKAHEAAHMFNGHRLDRRDEE
jgi:hypothetical protein